MRNTSTTKGKRKGAIGPEQLARMWGIDLKAVQDTVENTMQNVIRDFTNSKCGGRLKRCRIS